MSATGASPAPSKRAKIWRRTLVGGGLALALAALLWTVHATQSNLLVFAVGAVFAGLCVYEGTHLPKIRNLHLQAPAWVAWFVAVALGTRDPRVALLALLLAPWAASLVALGLAALDHRNRGRADRWVGNARLTLAALLVALVAATAAGRGWAANWLNAPRAGLWILLGIALTSFSLHAERAHLRRTAFWMSMWLVLPFAWLHLVADDWGVGGLVALAILSKIGDTAGYYAGSALGRHHPFPSISPGKTTEGCLASLVAGIAAGVGLVHWEVLPAGPHGLLGGAAVGAVTNIAAQAGDLFESWVKRKAGVKDSGTWFGPSGGVLDLVDSFLFSIPAALLLWPLLMNAAPGGAA
ncbi:MAG: phosphatidate cytidylyltransferase [Planctomycetes bacterium]|nr:phosphatidate cytidylyltransferase [Planctomycetota bacterium]